MLAFSSASSAGEGAVLRTLPGDGRVLPPGSGIRSRGSGLRVTIAAWLVSPSRWSFAPASTAAIDKTRWAETGVPADRHLIRFPPEALGSASETGQAAKCRRLNPRRAGESLSLTFFARHGPQHGPFPFWRLPEPLRVSGRGAVETVGARSAPPVCVRDRNPHGRRRIPSAGEEGTAPWRRAV